MKSTSMISLIVIMIAKEGAIGKLSLVKTDQLKQEMMKHQAEILDGAVVTPEAVMTPEAAVMPVAEVVNENIALPIESSIYGVNRNSE